MPIWDSFSEVIDGILGMDKTGLAIICNRADEVMLILWHQFIERFCPKVL